MSDKAGGKRVTLATVAEKAGVSVTTASVVLAGRADMLRRYTPATIEKVRRTAERLGYHANLFASVLPMKRPPFFALVLQDFRMGSGGHPHLPQYEVGMMAGITGAAAESGLYPVTAVIPYDPDEAAISGVSRLVDGGVMGTIVRAPNPLFEKFLAPRIHAGHPVVAVFPRRRASWPTNAIDLDNSAVGDTAARLLLHRRRSRLLVVCRETMSDAPRLRCEAFCRAAAEAGAGVRTISVPDAADIHRTCDYLLSRLTSPDVDGLFVPELTLAVGSLTAQLKCDRRPAEDFDLIGCDCGLWQGANLPTITSVDVSWEQVGSQAVQELAKMHAAGRHEFPSILLPPRVVPGGSCPLEDT